MAIHIRDIYFTYALGGLLLVALLSYAVRLTALARPQARDERVENFGGSLLIGQSVMNWWYWLVNPIVRGLVAIGATPNAVTWGSLVLGLGAGVAIGAGWFGLACLLATMSTVGDILDGQVARATGLGSNRGELLDAAVDRYTELAYCGGLVVYFRASMPLVLLALAALVACMMVSYASAKAEAMHVKAPRGLMRRHERATYLIVGAGLSSLYGDPLPQIVTLAIVAVIGNIAAVRRFAAISRAL